VILPASYQNGFAPRDGQPLYPSLWKGCVGAWNPGLGPSGLVLRDNSGFGNHGTLTNGPTWAASQGKYAMSFDGVNDYVQSTALPFINQNPKTLGAWVRVDGGSGTNRYILSDDADSSFGLGSTLRVNSANVFRGWGQDANYVVDSTTSPVLGQWYHVALTYSGASGQNKMFVNGILENTVAVGGESSRSALPLQIGRWPVSSLLYFNGLIDDVRIYNRALSPQEIRTLSTRRGIAYEMAPRRRSQAQVTTNRLRRALIGS